MGSNEIQSTIIKTSNAEVIAKTLRVVEALNKHLAEKPRCRHKLTEIMETALKDGN